MSDKQYATVVGFIQFDVEERPLDSGQTVRDATIRSIATGELVRITFWPDFDEADLYKGMFVAVDGTVTTREANGKTYVNMNARELASLVPFEKKEAEVVTKESKGRKTF